MAINGNRDIMEDLVYNLSNLFSFTPDIGSVVDQQLPLSTVFAGLGALVLGKFTGAIGGLTLPLNYSVLFIGAYLSNMLLHGLDLPIDRAVQQPMLISMIGMLAGAFFMMWWVQSDRLHA